MEIVLTVLGIILAVILVIGFSFIGAIIVYLAEEEKFTDDKEND